MSDASGFGVMSAGVASPLPASAGLSPTPVHLLSAGAPASSAASSAAGASAEWASSQANEGMIGALPRVMPYPLEGEGAALDWELGSIFHLASTSFDDTAAAAHSHSQQRSVTSPDELTPVHAHPSCEWPSHRAPSPCCVGLLMCPSPLPLLPPLLLLLLLLPSLCLRLR